LPRPLGEPAQRLAAELNYELPETRPEALPSPDLDQLLATSGIEDLTQQVETLSDDEVKKLLERLERNVTHEPY